MWNKLIVILLILSTSFSACKSRKNRNKKAPPVVNIPIDSSSKEATAESILGFTLKPWTYFSTKVDIEFKEGSEKKEFNASIRMYKDSLIWISAGLFGIEGLRILINKDSVVVLNRIEKSYRVLKQSAMQGFTDIPLTVTQMQNLLLAKPVYSLQLYRILTQSEMRMSINYPQEKFNTMHSYEKSSYTIDTTSIKDKSSATYAEAKYFDYSVVNQQNFPFSTFINASNGQKKYEITLKYSNVDFESILSFPCTIPSSYDKSK